MPPKKYISIEGPDQNFYGYGNMTVSLKEHLPTGVELVDNADVVVCCMIPDMINGWWKGQRRVVFTMWETSVLPHNYFEELSCYSQVIVPCEHNKELFSEYHDNISVVPLGIDPDHWKICTPPNNDIFTFITGGSGWWRKGLDLTMEAFKRLNNPGAQLIVKLSPDGLKSMPPVELPDNVVLYTDWMDRESEYDLYASADCFVSASRGEGFGLMPLQAISMGLPTIVSDMTGHSQFAHLANHALNCTEVPVDPAHFVASGNWYEVDVDELVEAMRVHVESPKKQREVAAVNAVKAHEWTWGRSAQALVDAVGAGGLLSEKVWQPATLASVGIVVNRNVDCHIADVRYVFRAGSEYLVPPNVKRIMEESGSLVRSWIPKHTEVK